MAKKVIIDIEVNSQSVDQAIAKTGELKKLSDKISIQYDIDGKPLDVVIAKSLNLQQQVKALTAELRRTKEGTAEFQLLSKQLSDAQDGLAKTTAKSKDLFSSLSLLPGPIGQFFGQLQGGIELLKTFSSFTFKDLAFQFKETANDIGDIGKNLAGVDSTKLDDLSESADEVNRSLSEAATQGGVTTATINKAAKEYSNLDVNLKNTKLTTDELNNAVNALNKSGFNAQIDTLKNLDGVVTDTVISVKDLDGEYKILTVNQTKAASATKGMITSLDTLVASEKVATFWTTTLGKTIQGVLIGTGIGIAIVVIGELVAMIYRMVTSEEEAETATRSLTAAFEEQQRVLANDLEAIDASNKAMQTRAKIAGESEGEINKIVRAGGKERLDLLREFDKQLYDDQQKVTNNTVMNAEDKEKLLKDINDKILKNGQDITKQILTNEQTRLDEQLRIAEKAREKQKAHLEKIKQDNKAADEALFQLQQENASLKLKDERQREDQELLNAKKAEEKKIQALEISEEKKQRILTQIGIKYTEKAKDIKKKRDDDDIKAAQDFVYKLANISIEAEKEGTDRDIASRNEKYKRDLADLEKDKLFIKSSEETKAFYRSELIRAKDADIAKIRLDAKIKEYQDELMLLEAQQKSLIAGTDAYQANAIAIENTAYQIKLANAKDNATQIEAVNKEHAANLKAIDLASFEAKKQIEIQRYQVVATIGQSLQALAGKQKGIAIAGVVVEKAAAIGQIWANNAIANAKATAVSPLTFGQPWVTVNTISAVLSTAATVAAAAKAISEINNPSGGSGDSGAAAQQPATPNYGRNYADGGLIGGNRHFDGGTMIEAERGEAIMTRGAVTMFQPMLSMMNQMGGGTGFAPSLVSTSYDNPKLSTPSQDEKPMIIKSYVVSGELTSEANKQARLKDLSTL